PLRLADGDCQADFYGATHPHLLPLLPRLIPSLLAVHPSAAEASHAPSHHHDPSHSHAASTLLV
ncbi:unnamed protein product, partial [Closterium sp. NIES-53]